MKQTVLTLILDRTRNQILMIYKKTGQGSGKWNFPGGKINPSETSESAAIRESQEETGLRPLEPKPVGNLEFRFQQGNSWDNHCTVFVAEKYSGHLIGETQECFADWVNLENIPYDKMWEADKDWVPLALKKEFFSLKLSFDANDRLIRQENLAK